MRQTVTALFDRYARETNRALTGKPDLAALGELYAEGFVGASPAGVIAGKKDDAFLKSFTAGFAYYRSIGTKEMTVRDVRVEPIDPMHALAHVDWRATYAVEKTRKDIDFTNVYLVRVADGGAKVFGWIIGDEAAELRKHGIID